MSFFSRLTIATIDRVLSPHESDADLRDLELTRREQRAVWDLEEQARVMLKDPSLSELERVQIRQAADNAYWDTMWGQAQRLTRRHWR